MDGTRREIDAALRLIHRNKWALAYIAVVVTLLLIIEVVKLLGG